MAETARERAEAAMALLLDAASRHQVYLLRYERGVLRQILSQLEALDVELANRLVSRLARLSRADLVGITRPNWETERLQQLLQEVRSIAQLVRETLNDTLTAQVAPLAAYEAAWIAGQVSSIAAVEFRPADLTTQQLRSAVVSRPFMGAHLRDFVGDLTTQTQRRVLRAIRAGYLAGDSIPQVTRRIATEAFLPTKRSAEIIARTAINHIANAAAEETYRTNADIVKGVKWVSTLDGRTSAVCRARDGVIFPIDKGPRPPAHPNCRSRTIPVLKTWADLGVPGLDLLDEPRGLRPAIADRRRVTDIPLEERPRRIMQVEATDTYNTWLRRQPREFVEDVLGKKKAALYLRGGMTLDRFVDHSGREYTLQELRRRDPVAFRRAGL